MRALFVAFVLVLSAATSRAHAQQTAPAAPTGRAEPPGPSARAVPQLMRALGPERDPGAFAQGAGVFGVVAAGALLGGSIAIAAVDDLHSERVTRGIWLGALALSTPLVALGGWT